MKAEIYSKPSCPWCVRAKQLLTSKNIPYTEYILGADGVTKATIEARVPVSALPISSVPQIFLNDEYIGGCTDLMAKLGVK